MENGPKKTVTDLDFISNLPDAVILSIFFDDLIPILDPISLACTEIAGGAIGKILTSNTSPLYTKYLNYYFRWIIGIPKTIPFHMSLRSYVFHLWTKSHCSSTSTNILLVGGNCDREITFASHPLNHTLLIRDNPNGMYCLGPQLKAARSACAAVRRPTDGSVFVFGGWSGEESIDSIETLSYVQNANFDQDTDGGGGGGGGGSGGSWRWLQGGSAMNMSRCFLGGASSSDGAVWALGGGDSLWQNATCFRSTEFFVDEIEKAEECDDIEESETLNENSGTISMKTVSQSQLFSREIDEDEGTDGWSTDDSEGGSFDGNGIVRVWQLGPEMNDIRCGLGACSDYFNNRIFAAGGYGGGPVYHASAEILDLNHNCPQWVKVANMSQKRTGCGVCMGPDGCYYVGGGSPDGTRAHRTSERFDPREGKWHTLPRMTFGRGYCSATFALSQQFVVSGGMDHHGRELRSVEVFDIKASKWIVLPSSTTTATNLIPRADHASIFVDLEYP